jgi:hypothetical protein
MSVFCVIVLRLLVLLKWGFQSSGIVLSFFILSSSDADFVAIVSTVLIILPELIMGSFLWIFRGVSSVCERGGSNRVSVFGSGALLFSSFHYIASLSSLGLSIGQFMEIPILLCGVALISCFFFLKKIKTITNLYLNIYC